MRILILSIFLFASLTQSALSASCNYSDDPQMAAQKTKCLAMPSKEWNCSLNRCMNTNAATKNRTDYEACLELDGEQRKKCHQNISLNKVGNLETDDPSHILGGGISTLNFILFGLNILTKSQGGSKCKSKLIIAGTGAVGFAQELFFRFTGKSKLEKIQEEFTKDENFKDPYEGQINAFKYLKEEQDYIASHAKKRKAAYNLLTAGYAAASGFALYEIANPTTMASCSGEKSSSNEEAKTQTQGQSQQAEPGTQQGNNANTAKAQNNPQTPKPADPQDLTNATSQGRIFANKIAKGFKKYISTSYGVLALGGIGAMISMHLAKASGEQQDEAEENSKRIERIIAEFKGSLGKICTNGRDDLKEPRCYCYSSDGQRNPNRTNSQTCQALYAQDDDYLYQKTKDKYFASTSSKEGCIKIDGTFDQPCRCRLFKDENGENLCKKVTSISGIQGLSSAFGASNLDKRLNQSLSGNIIGASGNLGGISSVGKLALSNLKARDSLISQTEKQRKKAGVAPLNFSAGKETKKFLTRALSSANRPLIASAIKGSSISAPKSLAIQQRIKDAQIKAGIKNDLFYADQQLKVQSPTKKRGYSFSFSDDGANKVQSFDEAPSKKSVDYDYANNDIVTREDVSIWKVITHRYNTSGLNRLFDQENGKDE